VLNKLCILNNKLLGILSKAKLDSPVKCLYTFGIVLPIPLLHKLQFLNFVRKYLYHKHLLHDNFNNHFSGSIGLLFFTAQNTNLIYSLNYLSFWFFFSAVRQGLSLVGNSLLSCLVILQWLVYNFDSLTYNL